MNSKFLFSKREHKIKKVDYKEITINEILLFSISQILITLAYPIFALYVYFRTYLINHTSNHPLLWIIISMFIISFCLLIWNIQLRKTYNHIFKHQVFEDNKKRIDYLNEGYLAIHSFYKPITVLFLVFVSVIFVFPFMGVFKQDISGSSSIFLIVIIYVFTILFFIPPGITEKYLSKNNLKYKFKFSDITCGNREIVSYLNSCLIFQFALLTFFILCFLSILSYTDFISNLKEIYEVITTDKKANDVLIGNTILFYLTFAVSGCVLVETDIYAIKAYHLIIKNLSILKKKLLAECEKKNDLASIIIYDKVIAKNIISPINKILFPIKLLISPTLMTFIRGIIFTTDDIDLFISHLFS